MLRSADFPAPRNGSESKGRVHKLPPQESERHLRSAQECLRCQESQAVLHFLVHRLKECHHKLRTLSPSSQGEELLKIQGQSKLILELLDKEKE